jgi:hypothetical protein
MEVMDPNTSGFVRQTGFGNALDNSRFEGVLEGSILNNMEQYNNMEQFEYVQTGDDVDPNQLMDENRMSQSQQFREEPNHDFMKMSGIEDPDVIKHPEGDHSFLETMPYRKDSAQDQELQSRFGRVSVIGAPIKAVEVVEDI